MAQTKVVDMAKLVAHDAMLHGRKGLIVQSLENYNRNLTQKQRDEKYCKMALSPYSFYRGSNHIFWKDFEWDWRMTEFGNYRTRTWLNGDCHAYNFGAYYSHQVGVVYGLNDFDESIIADYQYDLWRLAISLVLIPNEPAEQKFPKVKIKKIIDTLSESYLEGLSSFAGNKKAAVTCYTKKNTRDPLKSFLKKTEKKESQTIMLSEWTITENGQNRFDRKNPDVAGIPMTLYNKIKNKMPAYIKTIENDMSFSKDYFKVLDIVARLNAGTGSLGSRRYYVLIQGDIDNPNGNVILDVKEQNKPSPYPYATDDQKKQYNKVFANEGIRYTAAYRALDFHPDDHLGWLLLDRKYFGVRERNPYKKSFKTGKDIKSESDYISMAKSWGLILATEHARAEKLNYYSLGKEVNSLTKNKIKEFKALVLDIALGYAKVVNADYKVFKEFIAPDEKVCNRIKQE